MSKFQSLLNSYGYAMKKYGMAYYNPRMNDTDPTPELKENPDFIALCKQDQASILAYGRTWYLYGRGVYDQNPNSQCSKTYDEINFNHNGEVPVPEPYKKPEEPQGGQPEA